MQKSVPFFVQTTDLNCGPTALRMVLASFGNDPGIEKLEVVCGIKEGKALWTVDLAMAAAKMGCVSEFYSLHLGINPEHFNDPYYKQFADTSADSAEHMKVAHDAGVRMVESMLTYEEIMKKFELGFMPIILMSWSIVVNKPEIGYYGHFVPIIGMDEKGVTVHNQGRSKPQPSLFIPRDVFEAARKAKGTDEDLVFIGKTQ